MKQLKKMLQPRIPPLPRRSKDVHKGEVGRIMLVGGSPGMSGAVVLAGEAAYRSGAGLVHYCVPDSIASIVATKQTCGVVRSYKSMAGGSLSPDNLDLLLDFTESCDLVAIGPGLGRDPRTLSCIRKLVQKSTKPVVLDADGIHAFAGEPTMLEQHASELTITPHAGELARLLETTPERIQKDRERIAQSTAAGLRGVVVLKGYRTVVSDPTRTSVMTTGNPGMATGGSGDVLTGVIAGLQAQGVGAWDAALLGAHLHGRAGDLAALTLGEHSLMATDILAALPEAFTSHRVRGK